jgi:hypothetical protein
MLENKQLLWYVQCTRLESANLIHIRHPGLDELRRWNGSSPTHECPMRNYSCPQGTCSSIHGDCGILLMVIILRVMNP